MRSTLLLLVLVSFLSSCTIPVAAVSTSPSTITPAAHRLPLYLPMLEGKSVGMVVNQTSTIDDVHLVDTLLAEGVSIKRIFSPEHGFRGNADAGAKVKNGQDLATGLPIVSLYGKNRKPQNTHLEGLDVIVFDLQDVGVRFYTYISTLTLVMEAAAEKGIPVIVLDRPNPNGHYVDGPVLQHGYESFVGMHPVPIVYGMTIGEYAKMVNGEGWMVDDLATALTVIPVLNYDRSLRYDLPIPPSPNLPNARSVALYPSLCLLEGTIVSVGRGTDRQFQLYGHPSYQDEEFAFTPVSMPGATKPKLQGEVCYGIDLSKASVDSIRSIGLLDLEPLLQSIRSVDTDQFFLENLFFDKLAGNETLRIQALAGKSNSEIRANWSEDIDHFLEIRQKYLIYP